MLPLLIFSLSNIDLFKFVFQFMIVLDNFSLAELKISIYSDWKHRNEAEKTKVDHMVRQVMNY